jgi:hypothetical protein
VIGLSISTEGMIVAEVLMSSSLHMYAIMQLDGMKCISSHLPSDPIKVKATITLPNSTCVAIPVLTAPTSCHGVFLCI